MNETYRYDAFISYRHIEPDKTYAMRLQKYLEKYKSPKGFGSDFKKRISRVFRDESELVTSSDLGENIRNALENSEYLIVICSEETLRSKWCMQELSYFKELHNGKTDKILTLVVSGNPQEVFPEELCFENRVIVSPEGLQTVEKVKIEPLAANISSDTHSKSLKKLKTEYLRLAAPLLGCGYDDLYRRHQRRFVRNLTSAFCGIVGAAVLFTSYVLHQNGIVNGLNTSLSKEKENLTIANEKLDESINEIKIINDELETSNIRLTESEASLSESNENLKLKTDEALKNYKSALEQKKKAEQNEEKANIQALKRTVLASEALMKEGDTLGAIELLSPFVGKNKKISEGKAVTENFLVQALGVYNRNNIVHKHNLVHPQMVNEVKICGNGESVITKDLSGTVYLFSAKDGKLKKEIKKRMYIDPSIYKLDDGVCDTIVPELYLNDYLEGLCANKLNEKKSSDDDFWIGDYGYISKYSGVSLEKLWTIESEYGKLSFNIDCIVESVENSINIFDLHSGEKIFSYHIEENPYDLGINGKWIRFGKEKAFFSTDFPEYKIIVYDVTENTLVPSEIHTDYADAENSMGNVMFGGIFSAEEEIILNINSGLFEKRKVIVYDSSSGLKKWDYEVSGKDIVYGAFGKVYGENIKSYCDISFFPAGKKFYAFNSETGELLFEIDADERIANMHYSRNGYVFLITEGGTEYIVSLRNRQNAEDKKSSCLKVNNFKENINVCDYSMGKYAVVYLADNVVRLYNFEKNEAFESVFSNESGYPVYDMKANEKGTHIAVAASTERMNLYNIYIYDRLNNKTSLFAQNAGFEKMWFADNNTLMLAGQNNTSAFDVKNLKNIYSYKKSDAQKTYTCDSSVLFLTESFNLLYVGSDDRKSLIINEDTVKEYPELNFSTVSHNCVSERNNKIVFAAREGVDKFSFWLYDCDAEKITKIIPKGFKEKINDYKLEWIGDNTLILYSGSSYYLIDTEKKSFGNKVAWKDAAMSALLGLKNGTLAVALRSDSTVCLIDVKRGNVLSELDLKDFYIPFTGAVSSELEYIEELDAVVVKVSEQDMQSKGYIIDMNEFEIRSVIDGYCAYSKALGKYMISTEATAAIVTPHSLDMLTEKAGR